jgi:hypothetical protein
MFEILQYDSCCGYVAFVRVIKNYTAIMVQRVWGDYRINNITITIADVECILKF